MTKSYQVVLRTQNSKNPMYLVRDGVWSSNIAEARLYDANDVDRINAVKYAVKKATGVELVVA